MTFADTLSRTPTIEEHIRAYKPECAPGIPLPLVRGPSIKSRELVVPASQALILSDGESALALDFVHAYLAQMDRMVQSSLMNLPPNNPSHKAQWESVHICPRCGHILNLEQIDMRTITTGIVQCPKCDWEGPIEIQVTDLDGGGR